MTLVFKVLNNHLDNDYVIYALCIGVVGAIGYSLTSKILFLKTKPKTYVDTGVQTDVIEDDSDSDSDNLSDCSTETISPLSSTFGDRASLISSSSSSDIETWTQTIANQETNRRVIDFYDPEFIASIVEKLNNLDPFGAVPWTPERVYAVIETLGIVNNLFN